MSSLSTVRRRTADAYDVLRGRPPKPDYGILIVFPLIAASAGALIGIGVDQAVVRLTSRRNGAHETPEKPARGPALVHN
ncbi:hypothetical protein [Paractinoplanes brasiliensis]|nr:hypothetical protein [Actinoplanes brasiliensis]